MDRLPADSLFLGFDSSTQSLKVTALDTSLRVVASDAIAFDSDLPHYGTSGGAHLGAGGRVTAPTRMWMEAMDKLLLKLKASSFPLERVRAVSGSGQQHGTVYWKRGARHCLRSLDPSLSLMEQLASQLSAPDSPIWMDSSTGQQCREMEQTLGGALALASLSGSRAYERFSGPQIRRLAQDAPETYRETERISLVSSMGASLLLGDYAPVDHSDGAGTNLMDLRARRWSQDALDATAVDLSERLGELAPPHQVLGPISPFHVARHGFSPECRVVAWSGDNPCSLAGLALDGTGDVAISLGTSDTVFAVVREPVPGLEGHVFPNPVDPSGDSYMVMLCYKNASLTRQEIRDSCAGGSWPEFERALRSTQPLNGGCMGFYYSQPEILPPLPAGVHRFQVPGSFGAPGAASRAQPVDSFPADVEVRAVVEGQLLAMRGHAQRIGLQCPPQRIIATGGASANRAVLRVMADVFGCPVFIAPTTDSASLGAALRAAHGLLCELSGPVSYSSMLQQLGSTSADAAFRLEKAEDAGPKELFEAYGDLVAVRMELEAKLLGQLEST